MGCLLEFAVGRLLLQLMSAAENAAAPLPAVARVVALESFDTWASRHRRRAALDGAWRVEVSERVLRGAVTRSVTTWHDQQQQPQPSRQEPQPRVVPSRQKPLSRRAKSVQTSQPTSRKKQRSALRSAANHKQRRARALRRVLRVVLFVTRLWRTMMISLALRDEPITSASPASPGKRRLSTEPLDGETAPAVDDVASPPQPKRAAPSAPPSAGLRQGFLLR